MMKKEAKMTDSKFLAGTGSGTADGTASGGAAAETASDFSDRFSAASLILPVLLLFISAGFYEWELRTGRTFVFSVQKRDNRSSVLSKAFLSGKYLEYKVNYGLSSASLQQASSNGAGDAGKAAAKTKRDRAIFLCLSPGGGKSRLSRKAKDCPHSFLKGRLVPSLERGGAVLQEFQAKNLHRFYLSEKKAKLAEKLFSQAEKKEILVSVTKRGAASLRGLRLDGRSLKSLLASH